MRVAYLGIKGLPSRAGADRVVEAIATRMPAHGVTPVVYCAMDQTLQGTRIPGVELIRIPSVPGKYLRSPSLDLIAAFHALCLERYDLIHLHNVEASFVLPVLGPKYTIVSTSHGSAYWRAKWGPIARFLIRRMDYPFMRMSTAVTCVSAGAAKDLSDRFRRPVEYIPNGVSLDQMPDFDSARRVLNQHGLSAGGYLVFVAGRIEPTKGAHLAIEAVNRLSSSVPLLVIGDDRQIPSYGDHLRKMAGSGVVFLPPIGDSTLVFGLVASSRALIFPSTVEAMSMVLLEAASLGAPVVCSDIEENRAVMGDHATYFRSGDVTSLLSKLEWFSEHRCETQALAAAAKTRVTIEFSWDAIAKRYADLYASILAKGPLAHRRSALAACLLLSS